MFYLEKRYKVLLKYILYIFLIAFLFIAAIIVLSPYRVQAGFSYKLIKTSIEINAPAEHVFNYLGNSANASKWSSFVNHITVLNPADYKDGISGSRRRCFQNSNENGMQWDELITETSPNKKRKLELYNLKNFPFTAQNLATEQRYQMTGNNKCRLTFSLFFKGTNSSIWDILKMRICAYQINAVFAHNLSNIKHNMEGHK